MKQHFYSHIVTIDSLNTALESLELSSTEKDHLLALAQSNIHHAVLDAILSELAPADKILFLKHVASEDNKEIWELLSSKVEKIEDKIKAAADVLTKELHDDIEETKKHTKTTA